MHKIIDEQDLRKHLNLKRFGLFGNVIIWLLKKILALDFLNQVHHDGYDMDTDSFLSFCVEKFNLKYELSQESKDKIPKEGSFIIVGNHPIGGADGIVMMHAIRKLRPDFHITGNFILHQIKPLKPIIFPVNPFESHREAKSSVGGLQGAVGHLKQNKPLGFYPAGEVSKMNEAGEIQDRRWSRTSLKLIYEAGVPVIPMYCHAKNTNWFYLFGKIHPMIQTLLLPRQMIRKGRKPIKMVLGDVIPSETIKSFESPLEMGAFLREKTYELKSHFTK